MQIRIPTKHTQYIYARLHVLCTITKTCMYMYCVWTRVKAKVMALLSGHMGNELEISDQNQKKRKANKAFSFLCFFLLPIHIHLQLSQISTIQFLNMYVGIQFNYSICLAFNSIGDIWALFRFEYVCFDPLTSKHYSTNWLFRTHVWIILKDVIKHCCLGS